MDTSADESTCPVALEYGIGGTKSTTTVRAPAPEMAILFAEGTLPPAHEPTTIQLVLVCDTLIATEDIVPALHSSQ